MNITAQLKDFDQLNTTIAVLGSHSALDVCRGAKDEGFKTLVITQKGRGTPYEKYYKSDGNLGCVDEIIALDNFKDILLVRTIEKMISQHAIFIPHRSFEVYLNDYNAIEKNFEVPMFGNRFMLRLEERGTKYSQYDLLEEAGIRYPKIFKKPADIDRLCLVKVLEKERGFERAFFVSRDYSDYQNQVERMLKKKIFTENQLKQSVIEEFVLGVQVNFNFFYSPLNGRLELLGTDTRRQTNLEGFSKLPPYVYQNLSQIMPVTYEEAGHIAVTVLESMLEKVFEIGEKFVKASKKIMAPGVVGPFALQSIIIPGPPKKDIIVVDVSPRVPGSPGISSTPYGSYLFGKSMTVGRRIAVEIKQAIKENCLDKIVT
ncbi:hypothetical protein A3H78_03980 [Candidatus Roizmanbacteria bacterium RIFCSPLOWO2_02_FULL_36_11]|uniref:5-formaminoimidazole-4-carboxamide-1-(Beta)-D-ribofuranosyl 5'-monophosphate synthetase n=1 Tax=Candidatus Roizmanbacteria bacterium RIFCSPLOWO2_02_FULL_36_11 TaxID=1802071 RepID=A0A1F7JHM2_9BACT|nr:MAG: hypothetical protein A3H78_03980 [Candidatus Roizmanbacteria bacterium RIFCSPLOWO2_02_FULL_36_11]